MNLEEIFDTYYDRVYSFTLFRVRNVHDAEDIASDVFCKAAQNLHRYRKESAVSTWLISIALNEIKNYYRSRKEHLDLEYAENIPANDKPEDFILADERTQELYAAIKQLDERQRDVVLLRYYGEMNHKEISRLLKLTETNVETILYRAKKNLKNFLEKCEVSVSAVSKYTENREMEVENG